MFGLYATVRDGIVVGDRGISSVVLKCRDWHFLQIRICKTCHISRFVFFVDGTSEDEGRKCSQRHNLLNELRAQSRLW